MTWQLGIAVNAIIAVAYAAIAWSMLGRLARTGQLRSDRLGTATGVIFASCSVGHAGHLVHLAGLPGLSLPVETAAARTAYDAHLVLFDLVTAVAALVFFVVRGVEVEPDRIRPGAVGPAVPAGPPGQPVLEEVVNGLVVAAYQLDDDDLTGARRTLSRTLARARSVTSPPTSVATTHDHVTREPS